MDLIKDWVPNIDEKFKELPEAKISVAELDTTLLQCPMVDLQAQVDKQ